MVLAAGDTQVLDGDSSPSDCKASDSDGDGDDEIPILWGETQPLYDPDSVDDVGILDLWGKTQLVETREETAAVDSGDEETEGTELLSQDEEGSSDDGATCGPRDEGAIGGGVDLVDPDASTDDEADISRTSGHAAAARSSDRATSCCYASAKLCIESRSLSYGGHSEKEDNDVVAQTGLVFSGANKLTNNRKDLNSSCLEMGQMNLDHEIENPGGSMENYSKERAMSRSSNTRVKELFNEMRSCEKDEPTRKTDNIVEQEDSPQLLTANHGVGGLSYIGSQEPGNLSQANALEVVDKFLSINYMGSSQDAKNEKTDIMKPLPFSGTKGTQVFAEKMCCRIPAEKADIFDWNDNLEDDRGGEIFCKRKDSFFAGICGSQKMQIHPHKSRHSIFGITRGAFDNSGDMEGATSEICNKVSTLVQADLMMIPSSTRSERVHISVTTTEKNIFKDMDPGSNSRSLDHNLETPHADVGLQCRYVVGADTQMAAEAMEALVHMCPVNSEMKEGIHPADGILIESSNKSSIKKRVSSSNILLEKRTSTTKSEGVSRRSKRRKVLFAKSRKPSPNLPRDLSNKSKRSSEIRTVKVKAKKGKWKLEIQLEVDAAFTHPKRRRTNQVTSAKRNLNANLSEPSPSLATTEQQYKQVGKKKIFIRSGSEISDNTKQKKRSITTHMVRQAVGVPYNTRMVPITSAVKSSDLRAHKIWTEEIAPSELGAEDESENGQPEGLSSGEVQTLATPSKRNMASPIFAAQDPPRFCNKGLSRPLSSSELLRLEGIEAPSTPVLKDVRRRKDMASIRVLLSRHLDKSTIRQQKKILTRLGLPVGLSISDSTHFVTDKFVRTQNMLEAIAVGKPVVTPTWLESCGQASCFIDEKNYILRDYKKEKEIGFNMSVSLSRACQCPLLQGKRVYITPNVKPNRKLITSLVKASCGQEIERIETSAMNHGTLLDDPLVISCEEDYSVCIPLLQKGVDVFSSELLLNGIVIQKLEYERHRLFGITQ